MEPPFILYDLKSYMMRVFVIVGLEYLSERSLSQVGDILISVGNVILNYEQ